MAALTANRPIPNILRAAPYAGGGYVLDVPVGATEEIYQGSFVTLDTSDKFAAALTVPDAMFGMSLERATGGSSNGDVTCKVLCEAVIQHAIGSIAQASIGKPVYATDDQTLTITNDGSDTPIGILVNVPVTGTAIIKMFAPRIEVAVFTYTNVGVDKDIDVDAAVAVIGDGLGTLIRELLDQGIIQDRMFTKTANVHGVAFSWARGTSWPSAT